MANLLGVAKLKKKFKTDKDWVEARSLFLDSYSKAPTYDDALCNYAHISVKLRDFEHAFWNSSKEKKGVTIQKLMKLYPGFIFLREKLTMH